MSKHGTPASENQPPSPTQDPPTFAMEDSWETINAHFHENNWTDGLPIVPPTKERVGAMLDYAQAELGWERSDVIAVLAPRKGKATVEKISTNAVMAGCAPEYLPVLIAATKAMAMPEFNLFGVQTSTHNTSVLAIVNGPLREKLDINWGYNVVGSRWRSTASIGRAIRFIMTNIGGIPDATNLHTQGHIARYQHCIAENESESPWEALHVERGMDPQESSITVFGACPAMMIDDNSGSRHAKELLNTFARSIAYVGNRNINGEGEPLIIMCPTHARLLANGGYAKEDVKRFLWERGRVPFGHIPTGNLQSYSERFLKFYGDFGPDFGVPIADKPEDIVIVVMGGQGTHSLSVQTLLGSRSQTVPITRKDGTPLS
ncbi:MAG: hypothetical protein O7A08_12605 [SAR324 cluster bacterium]|nr:hypothetical protein [SAR324 cluster bacterium]